MVSSYKNLFETSNFRNGIIESTASPRWANYQWEPNKWNWMLWTFHKVAPGRGAPPVSAKMNSITADDVRILVQKAKSDH